MFLCNNADEPTRREFLTKLGTKIVQGGILITGARFLTQKASAYGWCGTGDTHGCARCDLGSPDTCGDTGCGNTDSCDQFTCTSTYYCSTANQCSTKFTCGTATGGSNMCNKEDICRGIEECKANDGYCPTGDSGYSCGSHGTGSHLCQQTDTCSGKHACTYVDSCTSFTCSGKNTCSAPSPHTCSVSDLCSGCDSLKITGSPLEIAGPLEAQITGDQSFDTGLPCVAMDWH